MKEYKAICLNHWVTVRQTQTGKFLLFSPSDETEPGYIIPANEIRLTKGEILKLAEWVENEE